ncbi:MAG: hypothetical protein Q8O78_00885, partial [Candidatus Deferrimicrobium sp.]|nr:hypothetical protein [Candidatus Deferrimicrobium sp.]
LDLRDNVLVKAQLVAFGDLRIEGERYERDVVIDARRRRRCWVRVGSNPGHPAGRLIATSR